MLTMKQLGTTLFVLVIVGSLFAPIGTATAASSAASASQSSNALESVPSENVGSPEHANGGGNANRGPPEHALDNIPKHAGAWDVHANDHAGTLEIEIDATSDGELLLRAMDSANHAGRTIAVDASTLEDAAGTRPSIAQGSHSSGDSWTSSVRYENGYAKIDVPKFSSNEITFTGGISLSGSQATHGTQYSYDVGNISSVSNLNATMTGAANRQTTSTSGMLSNADSMDVDVGGTKTPEDAELTLTGDRSETQQEVPGSISSGGSKSVSVGGNSDPLNEEVTLSASYSETAQSSSGTGLSGGSSTVDVGGSLSPTSESLSVTGQSRSSMEVPADTYHMVNIGETVNWTVDTSSVDQLDTLRIYGASDAVGGDHDYTFGIDINGERISEVTANGDADPAIDVSGYNYGSGDSIDVTFEAISNSETDTIALKDSAYSRDHRFKIVEDAPSSIDATIDGSTHSLGSGGSQSVDLSTGSQTIDWSIDSGKIDYDLSWTERTGVEDVSVSVGGSTVTHSGVLDGSVSKSVDLSPGSTSLDATYSGTSGDLNHNLSWTEVSITEDPSVDIAGQTLYHSGLLSDGQTVSKSITLDPGTVTAETTLTHHQVEVDVSRTEITETIDPGIEVNGHPVEHSGVLAAGETTSLAVDESWIQEGKNRVNVTISEPSTGPAPLADFSYSHDASGVSTIAEVDATTWSERYNVSHTFPSSQTDATATIPFASDRVIAIRDIEVRSNGSTWETPTYELNGTELEVDLGTVQAGETVDVRATGSKVRTHNGSIDVLNPTTGGDLNTQFEVVDTNGELYLDVGRTNQGNRLHELTNRSWSEGDPFTRFKSSGTTEVYLPGARAGSTATAQTRPLEVVPVSGDVDVSWHSDGTNTKPMFRVNPGGRAGDDIEYTYISANDGEEYDLYSESEGVVHDSATAGSPVTLIDDDSEETLIIQSSASESGGPSGGGGGFYSDPRGAASTAVSTVAPLIPPEAIALLVLAVIGAAIAYTERTGDRAPLHRREEVGLAIGISILLALMLISPAAITGPIQTALSAALPLASIFGVLGGAYVLYSWRQERVKEASTPDQVFRVGSSEDSDSSADDSSSGRWF